MSLPLDGGGEERVKLSALPSVGKPRLAAPGEIRMLQQPVGCIFGAGLTEFGVARVGALGGPLRRPGGQPVDDDGAALEAPGLAGLAVMVDIAHAVGQV